MDVPDTASICHCPQCRRWTGSALIGVSLPPENVTFEGAVTEVESSAWARRGFCARCGTGLYFRFAEGGPGPAEIELPLGVFDDANGFSVTAEIYIDHKPDSYAYAGTRKVMTRAECVAKFPALDSDGSG